MYENIEVINSKKLKHSPDLVCCHCGKEFYTRTSEGTPCYQEGVDYVFESDGKDEWCICTNCKKELDENN